MNDFKAFLSATIGATLGAVGTATQTNETLETISLIVKEPEVGEIYNGLVRTVTAFGAFVEIAPGKEGLCHISKLDSKRVEKVEDVVKPGDEVVVKVFFCLPRFTDSAWRSVTRIERV